MFVCFIFGENKSKQICENLILKVLMNLMQLENNIFYCMNNVKRPETYAPIVYRALYK